MRTRSTATGLGLAALALALALALPATAGAQAGDLWKVYDRALSKARYIDLTHTITPRQPVWTGFGPATFRPTVNPATGQPYTYATDGFEATSYVLSTDQFGTQLDPPAHWAPEQAAIDEIPATYSVRPLVVINIVPKVRKDPQYFVHVADIRAWEKRHGRIPAGSVVMVRSDWSKRWTADPEDAKALAADRNFSSVGLDALKFLHRKRDILFHGHEPLDTDTTPTLEGEFWLMHNGYAQAEGVANLNGVPATGCLVSFGFPKFKGGLGGYARYIAICPPSTRKGVRISRGDAPLPEFDALLHWDTGLGYRVR
jgi:kynurenine formamidase